MSWNADRVRSLTVDNPLCFGVKDSGNYLPKYIDSPAQDMPVSVAGAVNVGTTGYSPYVTCVRGNYTMPAIKRSEVMCTSTAIVSGSPTPTRYRGGIVYDERGPYSPWVAGCGITTTYAISGTSLQVTKNCYGMGSFDHYSYDTSPAAQKAALGVAKLMEGWSPVVRWDNITTRPVGVIGAVDLTTRIA